MGNLEDKFIIDDEIKNFPQIIYMQEFLIGHPGIIAGGCFKSAFTGDKPHDIDMFFRNQADFHATVVYFKQKEDEYSIGYSNKNVESFIHKRTDTRIECIKKIFGSPEQIIDQFDFTITKFAYEIEAIPPEDEEDSWSYESRIVYHPFFFEHLIMKRLVVDENMPYPISTLNRTYKYARSGYFPCRETKLKIIKAIQSLENSIGENDLAGAMYEGHD